MLALTSTLKSSSNNIFLWRVLLSCFGNGMPVYIQPNLVCTLAGWLAFTETPASHRLVVEGCPLSWLEQVNHKTCLLFSARRCIFTCLGARTLLLSVYLCANPDLWVGGACTPARMQHRIAAIGSGGLAFNARIRLLE